MSLSPATQLTPPARNLIVCCDGTNNEFGTNNTNVVRLVQSISRDSAKQRLYYDPGVGTLAEPGAWGRARAKWSRFTGLAFGAGIQWKVQEAYSFLSEVWQPGDEIFLFGFSRGAYTVRVLAGMLHALGLLGRGSGNMLPYAMRLFESLRDEKTGSQDWTKLCDEFRWTFARPVDPAEDQRRCPVRFLGIWDTVSSVGWVWNPKQFPFTARNSSIRTVRHAVALDERRWFFRQNLFRKWNDRQDVVEVWFPGVHSDVGGGYAPQTTKTLSNLWRLSFDWMISEAKKAGLQIDDERISAVLEGVPTDPSLDTPHESLVGPWKLAEYCWKHVWNSSTQKHEWKRGHRLPRIIQPGALIDRSVLSRLRAPAANYDPKNLSSAFKQQVRDLASVPATLEYDS